MKRIMIISTFTAFIGGAGTMLAAASCDPIDTVTVAEEESLECDMVARPSVYVVPGRTVDDAFEPVDVDRVWYVVDGPGVNCDLDPNHALQDLHAQAGSNGTAAPEDIESARRDAMCVESPEDTGCAAWIAGFEDAGRFLVGVEHCGQTLQTRIEVTDDAAGCHVQTQFVHIELPPCPSAEPAPVPENGGVEYL